MTQAGALVGSPEEGSAEAERGPLVKDGRGGSAGRQLWCLSAGGDLGTQLLPGHNRLEARLYRGRVSVRAKEGSDPRLGALLMVYSGQFVFQTRVGPFLGGLAINEIIYSLDGVLELVDHGVCKTTHLNLLSGCHPGVLPKYWLDVKRFLLGF